MIFNTGNVKVEKSSKGFIHVDFRISKNGSYKVQLDKGASLVVTVDVSPCRKCELKSLRQLDLTNQVGSPGVVGMPSPFGALRPTYDLDSPTSNHQRTTVSNKYTLQI